MRKGKKRRAVKARDNISQPNDSIPYDESQHLESMLEIHGIDGFLVPLASR